MGLYFGIVEKRENLKDFSLFLPIKKCYTLLGILTEWKYVMGKNSNNNLKKKKNIDFLMYLMALPILLVTVVMPLIMRLNILKTDLYKYPWYSDSTDVADIFLYSRAHFFVGVVLCMVIFIVMALAIGMYKLEYFKKKELLPLVIYGIFSIISAICSEYKDVVFNGSIEQYESIYVVVGYVILTYYVYLFAVHYGSVKLITVGITLVSGVMSVFGIMQYFGKDFFESSIGKMLIVPTELAEYRERLSFNFSDSAVNRVYMTLYNPNYVGVYCAMIIPVLVAISLSASKMWTKIVTGVVTMLLVLCDFASGSKTSLLAIVVGGCFYTILIFVKNRKVNFKILGVITIGIIIILGIDIASGSNYIQSIKRGFNTDIKEYSLEDISVKGNKISLLYKEKTVDIIVKDDGVSAFLNCIDKLPMEKENSTYKITKKGFRKISVQLDGDNVYLLVGKNQWHFVQENGDLQYITIYGKADNLEKAESIGFEGHEKLFTKRGYIWSRTLPLLKDNLLIGTGADTFVYEFPQDDYVMKTNVMSKNSLITRPHNMYLQTWVQEGMIAFISLMFFYLWYIICTVQVLFRTCHNSSKENRYLTILGEGLFMANICYLVSMMANDSMVVTAPMHFVIIGCSMAINQLIAKEQ